MTIKNRDRIAHVTQHKYTESRVEGLTPSNTDNPGTITKAMPAARSRCATVIFGKKVRAMP